METDASSVASSTSGYAQFLSFFYGSGNVPAPKSSKNTLRASQQSMKSDVVGVEFEAPPSTDSLDGGDDEDRER
jgi:hypothetical protein